MAQGKNLISHFQSQDIPSGYIGVFWRIFNLSQGSSLVTFSNWLTDLCTFRVILHVLPASKSYYFTVVIA